MGVAEGRGGFGRQWQRARGTRPDFSVCICDAGRALLRAGLAAPRGRIPFPGRWRMSWGLGLRGLSLHLVCRPVCTVVRTVLRLVRVPWWWPLVVLLVCAPRHVATYSCLWQGGGGVGQISLECSEPGA